MAASHETVNALLDALGDATVEHGACSTYVHVPSFIVGDGPDPFVSVTACGWDDQPTALPHVLADAPVWHVHYGSTDGDTHRERSVTRLPGSASMVDALVAAVLAVLNLRDDADAAPSDPTFTRAPAGVAARSGPPGSGRPWSRARVVPDASRRARDRERGRARIHPDRAGPRAPARSRSPAPAGAPARGVGDPRAPRAPGAHAGTHRCPRGHPPPAPAPRAGSAGVARPRAGGLGHPTLT
jgi:hypothetical protein